MSAKQLFKHKGFGLRVSLLALMAHALYTFVLHIANSLEPHLVSQGGHDRYLSWAEQLSWHLLAFCAFAFFIEIIIWIRLPKQDPSAWHYFAVMLVSACLCLLIYEADLSFHVFWGYGTGFEASDILLVFAVLFGFSDLLQTREVWMGGIIRYIPLVLAFLLSASV